MSEAIHTPTPQPASGASDDAHNASRSAKDELHMLVCDVGSAQTVLEETVKLISEFANSSEPMPVWAMIRLLQAVNDDVLGCYTRLDTLWLKARLTWKDPGTPAP
jgi:hypothetical protein